MKRLVIALMMLSMLALVANATPPPAPPTGAGGANWGMTWYDWDNHTGSWSSGLALYDPNAPALAGSGWVVAWNPTTYIDYAPITLELWIEMCMLLTYEYTSYQWHRLGDAAETISFTIDGTISSNESQIVMMAQKPGWDLMYLHFQENIFGGSSTTRDQIPITWQVRWGEGLVIGENIVQNWTNPYWLCGNMLLSMSSLPACDHWFQFEGTFSLNYHEADGYYKLVMAGCPYPEM